MSQRGTTKERVLRQLGLLKADHRGQVGVIERSLGLKGDGCIARYVNGARGLSIERLGQILDGFGGPPERFFAKAFDLEPSSPPPAVGSGSWLLQTLHLGEREPQPIQELRRAAENLPTQRPDSPPTESSAIPFARERVPPMLTTGTLRKRRELLCNPICQSGEFVRLAAKILDDHRYDKPQDAAALAHQLAVKVCPGLPAAEAHDAFATATGVFASSHRIAASHEIAARALAKVCDSESAAVLGDLMQRTTGLMVSYGRYTDALAANGKAMWIHEGTGDLIRIGQASSERAMVCYFAGELSRAANAAKTSLAILPAEEARHASTAHLCLAQMAIAQGNLESADACLRFAADLASDIYSQAMVNWVASDLLQLTGDFERAQLQLREVTEALWTLNAFDGALSTLDLLKLLMRHGEDAEAFIVASTVSRLLNPYVSNRIAEAAATELLKVRRSTGLNLRAVEEARTALQHGKRMGQDPRGARPARVSNRRE